MTHSAIQEFVSAMRDKGCDPGASSKIIPDDNWHRFIVSGDPPSKKNGSYKLGILSGVTVGFFCNHKEGVTHKFISGFQNNMTELEQAVFFASLEKKRREKRGQQDKEYDEVAKKCEQVFLGAPKAGASHPYLERKKIRPHNLRQNGSCLLIPITDTQGKIWSLGKIWPDGNKLFEKGSRTGGNFYGVWKNEEREKIICAEGVATGIAIHEATNLPVICALSANNMPKVAKNIKKKYPKAEIIVAADNDCHGSNNAGLFYGAEAAAACKGVMVYPTFKDSIVKMTDFWDFSSLYGADKLKEFFI